jgi:sporulation protein YlmC with PRC-barrel domain
MRSIIVDRGPHSTRHGTLVPMSDEDDIAISYDVLRRGTPVVDSTGEEVGTVHEVLDNAREHIFDGIVVATRDGRRFVDAPEVARITEKRVTLTIDAEEASNLPEHRGLRGSLETRAKRAGRRWKRRFGR